MLNRKEFRNLALFEALFSPWINHCLRDVFYFSRCLKQIQGKVGSNRKTSLKKRKVLRL